MEVEVEHATFVPLVMSATGGLAKQATSDWHQTSGHSPTVALCTGYAAPYPSVCSVQPSSARGHAVKLSPVDLVTAEALHPDPFHHPVHASSE